LSASIAERRFIIKFYINQEPEEGQAHGVRDE
jgi:hypothetical protein